MTNVRASRFLSLTLPLLFLFPLAMNAACSDSKDSPAATTLDGGTPDGGTPVDVTPESGTPATETFLPSNFDPSTIDMSLASDVDVNGTNGGCILDTDNPSTFSCNNQDAPFKVAVKQVAQPNGPQLVVVGVKSFRIESDVTLTINGTHPLAIYSLGAVSILGKINASASGSTEGNGASHANGIGEPSGASDDSHLGSAGASFCGKGGAGAPVGMGATFGTQPVAPYGSAALIPLLAGSSGGHHGGTGYGGGAVQITSLVSIDVSGSIVANGDAGGSGGVTTAGGAGGGSGGAILLEAPAVTGAGKLFANGGGGGSLTDTGSDGQESAQSAPGGGQSGGAGAAGTAIDGLPGSHVAGADVDNGGGGGGAGYIRINSTTGTAGFSGTASPALSTACGTQGPLRR